MNIPVPRILLIVDNESESRDAISRHFGYMGYNVLTATTGATALMLMKKHPVDILISDILLPEMSGIGLLTVARNDYPMVPVIMMAGYTTRENIMSCLRHGAYTCILKPRQDMAELEECINHTVSLKERWCEKLQEIHDLKPTAEFIDESEHSLIDLETLFLKIENDPDDINSINAIFRSIHSIKGTSASLGLLKTRQLAHHSESILEALRKGQLRPTIQIMDVLFTAVDELKNIMIRLRNGQMEVDNPEQFLAIIQKISMVHGVTPAPAPETSRQPESGTVRITELSTAEEAVKGRTVRINEMVLDELNALATELLSLHTDAGTTSACFDGKSLELLTRLQNKILALRKLPIQTLFRKVPRIIRDACAATGKKISLAMTGGSISVSRGVFQALDGALLHILRNAVAHGAETSEKRETLGKPRECSIRIEAIEMPGDEIALRINDDGQGIDFNALKTMAINSGVIPSGQNLSPQDLTNMLFIPGLSSTDKVTETSGRGMGMDIVKRYIESIGGRIEISSAPGQGTQFLILVPNPQ